MSSGAGCSQHVQAKFTFGDGPVMVFVDDANERLDWPAARRYLWDDLAQELLRTGSAKRIVPMETEDSLRRTLPDFTKRSCRQIGELAGAEQVLWIEVQDFLAEEMIVDSSNAAYWAVTVKVINPVEKSDRRKVRQWPDNLPGQYVNVGMTGAAAISAKTKDAIARALSAKMAVQISRLFHDHDVDQFEPQP